MSEPKPPTLLFMARVEADEDTYDDPAIIEPDQEADQEVMEQLLAIAVGHGTAVEVHQSGTADDLAFANSQIRDQDQCITELMAERDEARAAIVALEKEKHALQGQNRALNTEINGMATDPQACYE